MAEGERAWPRFSTIVADPPWSYGNKKWASITHNGTGPRIEKDMPYSTMSPEAICALPVREIAAKDCRLFLWVTNRHLPQGLALINAWGFRYVQQIVWHKTGNPSPFSGSGITPIHHELLLVAKKGKPAVEGRLPSSVVAAPKPVYGHSAKPEIFLEKIEQVSPGPYAELFSRHSGFPRPGWSYWGDESLGTLEMPEAA